MPDTKITALTAIGANPIIPATFPIPMVDLTDTSMAASGTTKKVTVNQILGAGGTATLASATITGDLTVDTNVLKVDSSGNRVSVNTTTFATDSAFAVKTTAGKFDVRAAGSLSVKLNSDQSMLYNVPTGNSHLFQINDSDAMTLNATGLGVGVSPAVLLDVQSASAVIRATSSTGTNTSFAAFANTGGAVRVGAENSAGGGLFTGSSAYSAVLGTTGAYSAHIGTSGAVRMTVDTTGNVGIGVTPKSWASGYRALQLGIYSALTDAQGGATYLTNNAFFDSVDSRWEYITNNRVVRYDQDTADGGHKWYSVASGAVNAAITWGNPLMTLDASGRLLVGATSALASGNTFQNLGTARQVLTLKGDDQTSYTLGVWSASATGDNLFQYFGTEASLTVRGGISYNRGGGLVAYNTTSDYRAKDIIGPVSNSGSLIDSLKVYVGKMKGATIERPMLIAHEAQEVAPYAVTGTKDEVDVDGNPKYQQMDVSALVPVLIAEIQSLRARVQILEAK